MHDTWNTIPPEAEPCALTLGPHKAKAQAELETLRADRYQGRPFTFYRNPDSGQYVALFWQGMRSWLITCADEAEAEARADDLKQEFPEAEVRTWRDPGGEEYSVQVSVRQELVS